MTLFHCPMTTVEAEATHLSIRPPPFPPSPPLQLFNSVGNFSLVAVVVGLNFICHVQILLHQNKSLWQVIISHSADCLLKPVLHFSVTPVFMNFSSFSAVISQMLIPSSKPIQSYKIERSNRCRLHSASVIEDVSFILMLQCNKIDLEQTH